MSTVEFKAACVAHRKCCPYKATGMTKCGANENLTPDGKCSIKDCHYMTSFKRYSKNYPRNEACKSINYRGNQR